MSRTKTVLCLAAATVINYGAWLAWDREKDLQPDGSLTGPYEVWQVVGFVLCLAVLAAVAGWNRHAVAGTAVISGLTWIMWTIDAANSDDSGLWVIGSGAVLLGCLAGVGIVSALVSWVSARRSPHREDRDQALRNGL